MERAVDAVAVLGALGFGQDALRLVVADGLRGQAVLTRQVDRTQPLLDHIAAHPEFVQPESRRNEILRLLEGGLEDISASRPRVPWGVPFPDAEGHTVYVWFDALPNYLSVLGFPESGYEDWWPAGLHVIGKDITRFHCVIWPAMLMSAGLPVPELYASAR